MRIDNPIGLQAALTGSFSGSFAGDGSGLTGVSGGGSVTMWIPFTMYNAGAPFNIQNFRLPSISTPTSATSYAAFYIPSNVTSLDSLYFVFTPGNTSSMTSSFTCYYGIPNGSEEPSSNSTTYNVSPSPAYRPNSSSNLASSLLSGVSAGDIIGLACIQTVGSDMFGHGFYLTYTVS